MVGKMLYHDRITSDFSICDDKMRVRIDYRGMTTMMRFCSSELSLPPGEFMEVIAQQILLEKPPEEVFDLDATG